MEKSMPMDTKTIMLISTTLWPKHGVKNDINFKNR